jgi:hypothetical protein
MLKDLDGLLDQSQKLSEDFINIQNSVVRGQRTYHRDNYKDVFYDLSM